jgi:restriction endonuclease S subunit
MSQYNKPRTIISKNSMILLNKKNKNSIKELFIKNLKMAEQSKMADIGSTFF